MTSDEIRSPFSYKQGYSKKVSSGSTDTQLVRMPWASPVQKPGILTKIVLSTKWGTAGAIDIWDADLSNTTPPTAGSAGDALISLEIEASSASGVAAGTTVYTADQLPHRYFVGGLACQTTIPAVSTHFEVEYI